MTTWSLAYRTTSSNNSSATQSIGPNSIAIADQALLMPNGRFYSSAFVAERLNEGKQQQNGNGNVSVEDEMFVCPVTGESFQRHQMRRMFLTS